jgi:hypothetical protein
MECCARLATRHPLCTCGVARQCREISKLPLLSDSPMYIYVYKTIPFAIVIIIVSWTTQIITKIQSCLDLVGIDSRDLKTWITLLF